MKKILAMRRNFSRGQSFIELALVFMVLMLLFAGVVELGNLINVYLDIIDAAREGARFSNSINFYRTDPVTHVKSIGSEVYDRTAQVVWATMNPGCHNPLPDFPGAANCPANEMKIPFDPTTDDIVISVVSYDGSSLLRFPVSGWSRFGNHVTAVTNAELLSHLDPSAPDTGFVLVEVFYDYHQLLGMPFFTNVLPDPIPVSVYSIMPYPNGEPTPTPLP